MAIYTAGFAEWTAEQFFGELKAKEISHLVDVRLNNVSQLAGFAKRKDLEFFLRVICGADYLHEPSLAPTSDLLKGYRSKKITWDEYETQFVALLTERKVESALSPELLNGSPVFLCSEHKADFCHRRVALDYLTKHWGLNGSIVHLV
jgi:uncharacterized protein (DUF488 family)